MEYLFCIHCSLGSAEVIDRWDAQCAITPSLFNAINRYSPLCELVTQCPLRNDTARSLQSLQYSTQLRALEVILDRAQIQALSELRKVLTTCTNLQKLQVSCISFPTAPGPGYGGHFTLCPPGWQLPPLKVLKLQEMNLVDYSRAGWETCVQWETLEHLQCMEIEFFPKISPSLMQLRSLGIHLTNDIICTPEQGNAVLQFARTSSTLKELCLTGMMDYLQGSDFLRAKNSSLEQLDIHENQNFVGELARVPPVLDREHIKLLGQSYPQLNRCSLKISVGSDWVYFTS